MHVQLFTLRFSNTLGGFDTTSLEAFVRRRDVVGFREHFFVVQDVPHVLCVVTWQDDALTAPPPASVEPEDAATARDSLHGSTVARTGAGCRRDAAPDPTKGLDEADRRLFNDLRSWRRTRSQEDGVPPYIVLTNRQLLEVVERRPDSANGLLQIHGVGPGKVKSYGEQVLELLRAHDSAPRATTTSGAPAQDESPPPSATGTGEPACAAEDAE